MILSAKTMVVTVAVVGLFAGGAGLVGGWRISNAFCNEKLLSGQLQTKDNKIDELQQQLSTYQQAAAEDSKRAEEAEARAENAQGAANELQQKISDGDCFAGDDYRWVRELWPPAAIRK